MGSMGSKRYIKLHGYKNEKVEDEKEQNISDFISSFKLGLDDSDLDDLDEDDLDALDLDADLDDDFYSDDYNIGYGDLGNAYNPTRCNMGSKDGFLNDTKKIFKFNKNRKPDFAITNTDVENANIKGFLTGLITGIISILGLLVFVKHTSKK